LRLDSSEGALADLKAVKYKVQTAKRASTGLKPTKRPTTSRYAIILGKPEESNFIKRIMTDDEDDIMPPIDSHLKLSIKEKDLLKRWITEGAKYDIHWSFKAPKKATLPKVKDKNWSKKAIVLFWQN
jgi:hypothetical protein